MSFSEFTVTEASFPTTPKDEVKAIVDEIRAAVPRDQRVISLDRVLAMVDTSQVTPRNVDGVKADPPPVFFSQTPAVLINLDGPADLESDPAARTFGLPSTRTGISS